MTGERRRFTVVAPDWGQAHLSLDAIVAYVDDELADGPHARATRHLAECPECAAQVIVQGQARVALRTAKCPSLPSSLLSSLCSIPQDAELPDPPAGLAVTSDGQLVALHRPERRAAPARRAATPPYVAASTRPGPPAPSGRPQPRRFRFGAGAAVSGLALGALAFGVSGVASGPPAVVDTHERGVSDGSVLGVSPGALDARLEMGPGGPAR